jgi:hypothetical protein|tara:strand:+ start:93 stop:380 length:288 start_codon:yes stop_codon:yes gene_type:complete
MEIEARNADQKYTEAKKRVEKIKGFYNNLVAYCLITPFLIIVNYLTYWEFKWFWFSAIGWCVGVGIHGFMTFGISSDWEERKIKELMNNDSDNTY